MASVKLKMEADATAILSALGGIENKLLSVFSVGAINQAIKATIDWAYELKMVSQQMNISIKDIQEIRNKSNNAYLPDDAIFSFYNRLDEAMQKAVDGGAAEAMMLQNLGVQRSDYGKTAFAAGNNVLALLQNTDQLSAQQAKALRDLTGEKNISGLINYAKDKSDGTRYTAPEAQVKEVAGLKVQMKSAGQDLLQVGSFITDWVVAKPLNWLRSTKGLGKMGEIKNPVAEPAPSRLVNISGSDISSLKLSGGGNNLQFGGTYGVDVQGQMLNLQTSMLQQLQLLVQNTGPRPIDYVGWNK